MLEEAFTVMSRARAQIRRPLDSRAQVTISIVDTHGSVLGIVRSPDAPIFGTDVSLQKARTAAFFSSAQAATELSANASADIRQFVPATRTFLNDPAALTGTVAFADRASGNLSRPYFPDGEVGRPHGPLSRPIAQFNPFSTGLQSALIIGNLGAHLGFVSGASPTDTPQRCTTLPDVAAGQNRLQNGIQIFPGRSPSIAATSWSAAIGVSGDGIDQDDMISFLGAHNGGARVGGIGNAPKAMRADNIVVTLADNRTVRLRYISCPFAPFLDTATPKCLRRAVGDDGGGQPLADHREPRGAGRAGGRGAAAAARARRSASRRRCCIRRTAGRRTDPAAAAGRLAGYDQGRSGHPDHRRPPPSRLSPRPARRADARTMSARCARRRRRRFRGWRTSCRSPTAGG